MSLTDSNGITRSLSSSIVYPSVTNVWSGWTNHCLNLAGIKINSDIFEGSNELAIIAHDLFS